MDVSQRVHDCLEKGEELLLLTDTDLDHEGSYGRRWLAVTGRRLLTFADDSRNGFETELALSDIREVKTLHHVGMVSVVAETPGRRVEVLRCTNAHAERFARVAKLLTDARRNGSADSPPVFPSLDDEEKRFCSECGRLLPERGSFCPACLKKHQVLARFWKYLKPHWGKALAASLTILAGTAAELAPPMMVKVLLDTALPSGNTMLLLLLVGGLLGIDLLKTGLAIVRGRISVWLGSRIIHDVRLDLYDAIQRLTLRRYDKTQVGSLMSRLTNDTNMLNEAFQFTGFMALPAVLQLVGICIILIAMNWQLGLLVLLPTPLVVAMTWWFFKKIHGYYFQWWQRSAKLNALANDCISGMRVVKAFSQEAQEKERFATRSDMLRQAWYNCDSLWTTAMPVITLVTTLGTFLVWYFGGLQVIHGTGGLTQGTLIAFIFYLGLFYGPLQMLTRVSDFLNKSFTSAQRLFEIMDTDHEVYDDPAALPLEDVAGAFEFKDVHFGYVPDKPVLKGVSVKVNPGEMIGLVGRSGVGKTTVINLICRFYDVEEGSLLFDDRPLREYRLRDLRRHIGIVPQEVYLFNGRIFDNIAYARPDASRDEVIEAAIAANAHGFIMRQPDGYDTRVGERGAQLSGGERQRIAIARALLHNPKILILDEATSSVDTETEELIQEALTRLVAGRTTFAIAHRLSTLRNADRLLVIDEGRIVESGSHEELMAKKGLYATLVEMQSSLSAAVAAVL
jgi:ATP-binding cassette, subfamily B, bacterial